MTNEEITQYNWHSFLQGDKVMMKPIAPHAKQIGGFSIVPGSQARNEWLEFENANTFLAIGIEPNKTYAGSELELVWQYKSKEDNPEYSGEKIWVTQGTAQEIYENEGLSFRDFDDYREYVEWGFEVREVLRLKSIAYAVKPFPETVEQVERYEEMEKIIGNPDLNFPMEEMLEDLHRRMDEVNHLVETVEQAADKYANEFEDGRSAFVGYRGFVKGANWKSEQPLTLKQIQGVLETMRDVCNIGTSQFEYFTSMAEDIYNKQFER